MGIWEETSRVKLLRLNISVEQLAQLTSIRSQVLFSGLKGTRPLTGPQIETVERVLARLQDLMRIVPTPLDCRDTRRLKFLLDRLDEGDLERCFTPRARAMREEMDVACV